MLTRRAERPFWAHGDDRLFESVGDRDSGKTLNLNCPRPPRARMPQKAAILWSFQAFAYYPPGFAVLAVGRMLMSAVSHGFRPGLRHDPDQAPPVRARRIARLSRRDLPSDLGAGRLFHRGGREHERDGAPRLPSRSPAPRRHDLGASDVRPLRPRPLRRDSRTRSGGSGSPSPPTSRSISCVGLRRRISSAKQG